MQVQREVQERHMHGMIVKTAADLCCCRQLTGAVGGQYAIVCKDDL